MKPKPFSALKNFTIPVVTDFSLLIADRALAARRRDRGYLSGGRVVTEGAARPADPHRDRLLRAPPQEPPMPVRSMPERSTFVQPSPQPAEMNPASERAMVTVIGFVTAPTGGIEMLPRWITAAADPDQSLTRHHWQSASGELGR